MVGEPHGAKVAGEGVGRRWRRGRRWQESEAGQGTARAVQLHLAEATVGESLPQPGLRGVRGHFLSVGSVESVSLPLHLLLLLRLLLLSQTPFPVLQPDFSPLTDGEGVSAQNGTHPAVS